MSDADMRAVLTWRATILTIITGVNVLQITADPAYWDKYRFVVIFGALATVYFWITAIRAEEDPEEAAERIYRETRVHRPLSASDVRDEARRRYPM